MTIRLDAASYDRRWNLVGAGRGGVMGRIYRHPFNPLQNSLGISVRAFGSEATIFGPFVPASQIVGLCVFESQSLPSKHNFCNPSPPLPNGMLFPPRFHHSKSSVSMENAIYPGMAWHVPPPLGHFHSPLQLCPSVLLAGEEVKTTPFLPRSN